MSVARKEYMIAFEHEKCTQCHGCEIACKTWRGLEYGVQYRRVLNFWQGSYPQVKNASLSLSCLHCVNPSCMNACPEEAISKSASEGLVLVDETLCSACGVCGEACPFGIPQFGDNGIMQKCDLCCDHPLVRSIPPCVDTCPGQTMALIEVSQDEKLVQEEKIARLLGA